MILSIKKAVEALTSRRGLLVGGGILGAGMLANKLTSAGELGEQDYIPASLLGMSEGAIRQELQALRSPEALFNRYRTIGKYSPASAGRQIHKQIQGLLSKESYYEGSEVRVTDSNMGVAGSVDVVINMGGQRIPVEVKTTEDVSMLSGVKPAHKSQLNFYSHAMGAPGGYVMYVGRGEKRQRRMFYVPYEPGALISDVQKVRTALVTPGIRQSYPTNPGEFETMKPHPAHDFPGGRSQLFRQEMRKVLGLSDEVLTRSAFSAADAAKIRGAGIEDWQELGRRMYGASIVSAAAGKTSSIKFVAKKGGGNILTEGGRATVSFDPDRPIFLVHELIELSEHHRNLLGIFTGANKRSRFGTHYSRTVLSEEARVARAMGPKASVAVAETRHGEYWDIAGMSAPKQRGLLKRLFSGKPTDFEESLAGQTRAVFGHLQSYASGLKRMKYHEFDAGADSARERALDMLGKMRKSKIRDQTGRNSFSGPGFPTTPLEPIHTNNPGSRHSRRN